MTSRASEPLHAKDLGASDRTVSIIRESKTPGVVQVRVEIGLRREVEHMDFRRPITFEIPDTLDHLTTVLADHWKHQVLVAGEIVETPRYRPKQHAEIDRPAHYPRLRRRRARRVKKVTVLPDITEVIRSRAIAPADVELLVSAFPTPVLVADYSPIIARFEGMGASSIRTLLREDEDILTEALSLPRALAASPEWVRLYGSPLSDDVPDFSARRFTREAYPDLHETLVQQFTAPFTGRTSLVREHTAPTLFGDVVVRSHWKAVHEFGEPRWDRIVIVDLDVTDLRATQRTM